MLNLFWRRPGRPSPLLRVGAMLATALCVGACIDGYPTESPPILHPFEMTQHQRLAEMNLLGEDAHSERRWTYALRPGCVLRVDFDGSAGPRPPVDIPLLGGQVTLASDKADGTFDVNVVPAGARSAVGMASVLESESWSHASFMSLLLKVVQVGCSTEAGTKV